MLTSKIDLISSTQKGMDSVHERCQRGPKKGNVETTKIVRLQRVEHGRSRVQRAEGDRCCVIGGDCVKYAIYQSFGIVRTCHLWMTLPSPRVHPRAHNLNRYRDVVPT